MKRLLSLLLALVLCVGLTGCLSHEEQQNRKLAMELVNGSSSVEYALSTGTTLKGQRIYEDNSGLIVYLAGIKGTPRAPQLVLAVKNGTRHDLSMSVANLTYNNWAADGWVDTFDFDAHSASMTTISCDNTFALLNLADIHTLSMDLFIYTSSQYDQVANASISLDLGNEPWVDDYQAQGIPLLDSNQVQVVAQSLRNRSDQAQISLYANNQSNRSIRIASSNITLNDKPVEMFLWSSLSPNARRMIQENIMEEDTYNELSLAPNDELKFRLQISDDETGAVLDEVDVTLHNSDFADLPVPDTTTEPMPDPVEDTTAAAPTEDPAEEAASEPAA